MDRYSRLADITGSDTVDLPGGVTDAIYVGGAGNIVAIVGGTTSTIAAVAGAILPLAVSRVNATSTTATGLKALYKN
jgi:hypothetical protein